MEFDIIIFNFKSAYQFIKIRLQIISDVII